VADAAAAAAVKAVVETVVGGKLHSLASTQTPVSSVTPVSCLSTLSTFLKYTRLFAFSLCLLPSLCFSQSIEIEDDLAPPLSAEEAFVLSAEAHKQSITLHITIAPGYLLYQDHLLLNTLDTDNNKTPVPLTVSLPQAITKSDPVLGDTQVYKQDLTLEVPLAEHSDLLISYQGCSDSGFCYAPEGKQIHIDKIGDLNKTVISSIDPDKLISTPTVVKNTANIENAGSASESDRLTHILHSQKTLGNPLSLFRFRHIISLYPLCTADDSYFS